MVIQLLDYHLENQKEIIIGSFLFLSVQNSKCVIVENLLGKKFITCLVFTLTIALLSGCFPDLQSLNFVLHQQHEIQNIKNSDSHDHNSKPNGHEHHSEVCTDNCIENSNNFSLTIHIFEEKFFSRFALSSFSPFLPSSSTSLTPPGAHILQC